MHKELEKSIPGIILPVSENRHQKYIDTTFPVLFNLFLGQVLSSQPFASPDAAYCNISNAELTIPDDDKTLMYTDHRPIMLRIPTSF